MSSLARDADVSHTTVRHWLSVLEAAYLIFFIKPWHENYNKRLVKSPKLYFYDTGLAGHLAGITAESQWHTHPLRGFFFENLVVAELLKSASTVKGNPQWFFWSSPGGAEVDILMLSSGRIKAFEIKSGATFRPESVKNLVAWKKLTGREDVDLFLLYTGSESFQHGEVRVRPWQALYDD